jgi:hypothetical protein
LRKALVKPAGAAFGKLREAPLLLRIEPEGAFYRDAATASEFFDVAALEVPRVGWYWFAAGDSVTDSGKRRQNALVTGCHGNSAFAVRCKVVRSPPSENCLRRVIPTFAATSSQTPTTPIAGPSASSSTRPAMRASDPLRLVCLSGSLRLSTDEPFPPRQGEA